MNSLFKILLLLFISLWQIACNFNAPKAPIAEEDVNFHNLLYPEINFLNDELASNPNNDELLHQRAVLYLQLGNLTQALDDVNKSIQINNVKAVYYLTLFKILYKNQQYNLAINALKKFEMLEPNQSEVNIYMSKIYFRLGNIALANSYLTKAKNEIPHHADISFLDGFSILSNGDTARAIPYFVATLKKNYKHEEAYENLIHIYSSAKKSDSALYYSIKAIEYNPYNPLFKYQMGNIFQSKDLDLAAMQYYQQSLKIDTAYIPSLKAIALNYLKLKHDSLALPWLLKILSKQSFDEFSNLNTAQIYYQSNRKIESKKYFYNYLISRPDDKNIKAIYEQLLVQYPDETFATKQTESIDSLNITTVENNIAPIPSSNTDTSQLTKPRKKKLKAIKTDIESLMNTNNDIDELPQENSKENVEDEPSIILAPQDSRNDEATSKKKSLFKKKNKIDTIPK
jgi:predicted Zn-dependent protease